MRLHPLVAVCFMAAVLSGCFGGGGGKDPGELPPPPKGTGTLHVIVVDSTITPIPGVRVTARTQGQDPIEGETDAGGELVRTGVPPGDYIVLVGKPGFLSAQSSATVVADEADPDPVRVQMETDPEGVPYFVPFQWDGFIECGTPNLAVCSLHTIPCEVTGQGCVNATQDDFDVLWMPEGLPDHFQAELVWDSTQSVSPTMYFVLRVAKPEIYAGGEYEKDIREVYGPSPLLLEFTEAEMAAEAVGTERGIVLAVFGGSADGDPSGSAGVTISQKFTAIGHAFFGYTPPEGWRYSEDQDVPLP